MSAQRRPTRARRAGQSVGYHDEHAAFDGGKTAGSGHQLDGPGFAFHAGWSLLAQQFARGSTQRGSKCIEGRQSRSVLAALKCADEVQRKLGGFGERELTEAERLSALPDMLPQAAHEGKTVHERHCTPRGRAASAKSA